MKICNRNSKKEVQPDLVLQLKMDCIRKDRLLSDILCWLTNPYLYSDIGISILIENICTEFNHEVC